MAHSKKNHATHGLSGKVNVFVYRQRFGKTVVADEPKKREYLSAAQETIVKNFKKAVRYAKQAFSDPALKAAYQAKAKPGQTAQNIAIADYFKAPEIDEILTGKYNGQPGSIITVDVTDDFMVAAVTVKIAKADGSVVEEGNAALSADDIEWQYIATVNNASPAGCIISITASDLPGNTTVKQKTIS